MIYAMIVLYNLECDIKRIKDIESNNIKPIVFDNSTTQSISTYNELIAKKNNVTYHTLGSNIGLSKAYNFVIKKYIKESDWIIILDQDTDVPNEFYAKVNNIVNNPDRLAYLSIFEYSKGKYCPKVIKNAHKYKVINQYERKDMDSFLLGINTCSLYSGKLFTKVGYFNEELFLDYIDLDFCLRIALANIKVKTININIKQHFFSKEKSALPKVKSRLSIQKHDAKMFYSSNYLTGFLRKRYCYIRDMFKYTVLYCLTNKLYWIIPLMFVKAKKEL